MFVLKSKYKELEKKYKSKSDTVEEYYEYWLNAVNTANQMQAIAYQQKALLEQNAELINALIAQMGEQTFNQDEIKMLIRLCHPDKHNNSDSSNAMTQRLLELRKK